MTKNRHGLKRHIPEETKRIVRQSCSFGCVVCGAIPYDYDHFRNQYAEVEQHDPDDIVLLCDKHHRQKNGGILSADAIARARKSRTAAGADTRFKLDVVRPDFEVRWGSNIISASDNSIMVDGEPILTFKTQDNDLEPILLSGQFRDRHGRILCVVENNEFIARAKDLGDLTVISNRFNYVLPDGSTGFSFSLSDAHIAVVKAFHVKSDAHVIVYDDGTLKVGNLIHGVALRESAFRHNQIAISVGTSRDEFSFENVALDRLPTAKMQHCMASNSRVGIFISGRARARFSAPTTTEPTETE